MTKAMKSVLKKAAKYGAVYVLGFLTAVAVFVATADPMKDRYTAAVHFNLDTGTHLLDGTDVGRYKTAALKYRVEWKHIFKRHKVEEILAPLAQKGVVNAMEMLAHFNRESAYTYRWWPNKRDTHAQKALYWAREAARHGSASAITSMVMPHTIEIFQPTPEDLALVEGFAQLTPGAASALARYYANEDMGPPRDIEKANYWHQFQYTHQGFIPGPIERPTPVLTEEQSLFR